MRWWKSGGASPVRRAAKPGLFLQNYANQRVAALNIIMGSVITGMSGAYPTFNSKKCGKHYLAEFTYPFNAHFNVKVKL
jgi:hypothetical protein